MHWTTQNCKETNVEKDKKTDENAKGKVPENDTTNKERKEHLSNTWRISHYKNINENYELYVYQIGSHTLWTKQKISKKACNLNFLVIDH